MEISNRTFTFIIIGVVALVSVFLAIIIPVYKVDVEPKLKQKVTFIGYMKPNEKGEVDKIDIDLVMLTSSIEERVIVNKDSLNVAVYQLISEYKDLYIKDYGTVGQIRSLKCKRSKELIQEDNILKELNKPCK